MDGVRLSYNCSRGWLLSKRTVCRIDLNGNRSVQRLDRDHQPLALGIARQDAFDSSQNAVRHSHPLAGSEIWAGLSARRDGALKIRDFVVGDRRRRPCDPDDVLHTVGAHDWHLLPRVELTEQVSRKDGHFDSPHAIAVAAALDMRRAIRIVAAAL